MPLSFDNGIFLLRFGICFFAKLDVELIDCFIQIVRASEEENVQNEEYRYIKYLSRRIADRVLDGINKSFNGRDVAGVKIGEIRFEKLSHNCSDKGIACAEDDHGAQITLFLGNAM